MRALFGRLAGRRALILATLSGLLVGVALALTLASAQNAHSAAPATITIDNFTFGPQQLDIGVGTTVTWVNHDDIPHSVVNGGKAFRSKALDTDESYSFTFTTPGTFDYFCGLHPHMVGKVVVKP